VYILIDLGLLMTTVLYLDMCRVWRDVYWFTHCQDSGVYLVGCFKTGRVLSAWVSDGNFINCEWII